MWNLEPDWKGGNRPQPHHYTNHYGESFNKTFSGVVGDPNPTIYNFLSAVQLEHASTESKISCYRQGWQPTKRSKWYLEKDASLKIIVRSYHKYESKLFGHSNP